MSLVSGLAFGGLLGYGAYRTSANPKDFMFVLGECVCVCVVCVRACVCVCVCVCG